MKKISKLIVTWAISYIIILVIPVFFSNVYGYHSIRSIKNESSHNRELMVSNVQDAVNRRISELSHIARNLQVNNQVLSISYNTDDTFTNLQYTYVNSLQKTCSGFIAANSLLAEIYLYFPNQETVISSKSIFREDLIGHMSQRIISREILHTVMGALTDSGKVSAYTAPSGELLIVMPLVAGDDTGGKSFCLFLINEKELSGELKDILQFGDSYIIVDDRIVGENHLDNTRNNILYIPTEIENMQLAYMEDARNYDGTMKEIYMVFFVTSFLSVALGILITYYQVKKNYRPLKKILSQIDAVDNSDFGSEGEYGYILKSITNNQEKLSRQRGFIREEYISRLILGEYHYDKLDYSVIKELELENLGNRGAVIIVECQGKDKDSSLCLFAVKNILSELFRAKNIMFEFADAPKGVQVLVQFSDGMIDRSGYITELQFLYDYMWKHFEIALRIGVGRPYESIDDISYSYSDALETIEIMKLNNLHGVCERSRLDSHSIYEDMEVLNPDNLICMIENGDREGVSICFNDLKNRSLDHTILENEANAVFFFCYRVCDSLAKDIVKKSPQPELLDLIKCEYDWKKQSIPEALSVLEDICIKSAAYYGDKDLHKNPLVLEVNQYIDSNFIDSNMNINSIAEKFNFTPAYLSQKYKEACGESIIDYLYRVRVEQSKKIMEDTSISINEIATMVGFLDSNAFIRIFKKMEGVTPGKYRKGF